MRSLIPLLLVFCALSWAQEPRLGKGRQALSLYVSPDFEGVTGDMLRLEAAYLYFFGEKLALGASADYATIEDIAPGEKDYRFSEIDLGITYHFDRGGSILPYLGASLGFARLTYLDLSDSSLVYGPDAGLQFFFTKTVAVDLSLAFRTASNNVFVNDFIPEDSDLTFSFGLRVLF